MATKNNKEGPCLQKLIYIYIYINLKSESFLNVAKVTTAVSFNLSLLAMNLNIYIHSTNSTFVKHHLTDALHFRWGILTAEIWKCI